MESEEVSCKDWGREFQALAMAEEGERSPYLRFLKHVISFTFIGYYEVIIPSNLLYTSVSGLIKYDMATIIQTGKITDLLLFQRQKKVKNLKTKKDFERV